jgi:hypothetical protein
MRIQYLRAPDGEVEKTFYLGNEETLVLSADGKFLTAAGGSMGTRAEIRLTALLARHRTRLRLDPPKRLSPNHGTNLSPIKSVDLSTAPPTILTRV